MAFTNCVERSGTIRVETNETIKSKICTEVAIMMQKKHCINRILKKFNSVRVNWCMAVSIMKHKQSETKIYVKRTTLDIQI